MIILAILAIVPIVLLACVVHSWIEERYPEREAIPTCYWKNPCGMCRACLYGETGSSLAQTVKGKRI